MKVARQVSAILVAVSFIITSSTLGTAFAEPTIEVNASPDVIKALDTVLITGKITDVSEYKPVRISVMAPDGEIAYAPFVPIGDNGEFRKLLQPTLPSFMEGTYTVTVSHEETEVTVQTEFTVLAQEIPRNQIEQQAPDEPPVLSDNENPAIVKQGISITADAVNGSDTITISGSTPHRGTDITMVVSSPTGNIITIAQATPGPLGDFEMEIKTGGSLWKEDGEYTITANQGTQSEYKDSIVVEIEDGVVVPEFGMIAMLVFVVSVIAVIAFSARTKLSIMPRY